MSTADKASFGQSQQAMFTTSGQRVRRGVCARLTGAGEERRRYDELMSRLWKRLQTSNLVQALLQTGLQLVLESCPREKVGQERGLVAAFDREMRLHTEIGKLRAELKAAQAKERGK